MSQRLLQGLRPAQVTWCYLTPVEGQHKGLVLRGWPRQEAEGPGTEGHPRDGKTGLWNVLSYVMS